MSKPKLFLDSDIILDVLLEREEFYEASARLLDLGDSKKIHLYTSSLVAANIYYILRKELKSNKKALECIKDLFEIIRILGVDEDIMKQAINTGFSDYEDSIQYIVAKNNGLDYLISRNKKDYKKADIKVLNAAEMLEKLEF